MSLAVLARGTRVAGYRVASVLGQGKMGVVYRAHAIADGREVALKLLADELSRDSEYRARFEREGCLQALLEHEHIVPVYETGECEHGLYMSLRLIDGPSLKELILEGAIDPERCLRLLFPISQALEVAHAAGLVHRDVKPQNVLVGPDDHAYLADFGLLKALADENFTKSGTFIGTIDYMAPEQISGEPVTAASDSYALAAVLFESLTGEVPFTRPTQAATLFAHMTAPPPRVTEFKPDLPAELDDVIALGMAKDPTVRPTPSELIQSATKAFGFPPPPVVTLTEPPLVEALTRCETPVVVVLPSNGVT